MHGKVVNNRPLTISIGSRPQQLKRASDQHSSNLTLGHVPGYTNCADALEGRQMKVEASMIDRAMGRWWIRMKLIVCQRNIY
ncbi:hypothetical protein P152DRAFT_460279 [Eremomyces bilateralis CBS 781.70]|uniref:Uncharacterized protein n=1 Tax=Eremomyces bilateralis CBS 781.70 TaxID=1392243 RepID=A0A6G1FY12_9PEZI|nr:uncharacterized protein P152DRAFT_460279 [Eremomyces bilateralis CBS 781.70]KAF1810580.1 hypothetical protein P152DRAFT_460279 [Eremomyces bilateralis CBS 781.70]